MKKAILVLLPLACLPAAAQHVKTDTLQISEAVVTGVSGPTRLRESPIPFTYVSSDMLAKEASANIVDAIARFPGVSQVTTGGSISKPVIRGLGYNRVVVVKDGVRQEGSQWGDEHGLEVDSWDVGSVEVLKGPASLLYGSDAIGGVLILGRQPSAPKDEIHGTLSSEYQSNNGLIGASLAVKGNNGGVIWSARYSQMGAHSYRNAIDGYVLGSQYGSRSASASVGVSREWGSSFVDLSYYNLNPSLPELGLEGSGTSYGRSSPYQDISHYKVVWDNSISAGDGLVKLILGYQQNRRKEYEDEGLELDMKLGSFTYDLRYTVPLPSGWKVASGIGGMYQGLDNLAEEQLVPEYTLFDIGAYATASRSFSRWDLSGGLRADRRGLSFDSFSGEHEKLHYEALTGSLGAVFHPVDGLDLRVNAARGFRSPNISEVASDGVHEGTFRYEKGDPLLKAEKSIEVDAGASYSRKWMSFDVSFFANRISNYIYLRGLGYSTDDTPTYGYVGGDALLTGGEAVLDIHPVEPLHIGNSFSFVEGRLLGDVDEDSRYLPFIPSPRWTSEVSYSVGTLPRFISDLTGSVRFTHSFAKDHFYAAGGTETATDAYSLVDITLSADFLVKGRTVTLSLMCNNLFDKAYQDHLSRLKYAGFNEKTHMQGLFNMGRNFAVKLVADLF